MRITLARAGPIALAFDCDLATFGFPFEQARLRKATRTQALRGPAEVAAFVSQTTSIGEGGEHFTALVESGRFAMHPFPGASGFPAGLGQLVATTPNPDPAKRATPLQAAQELAAGRPQLLLFGLGPRGLPPEILEGAPRHLEITGRGISLETATALGALPAMVRAHLEHLVQPAATYAPDLGMPPKGKVKA